MATNDRELDHVVRSHVAALPYQQRAAIVLTYYGGYPSAEAADAMGCSESTVRVHLHRARQALGAALQMEVDDAGR